MPTMPAVYVVIDFDHLVLRVADVEASLAWYVDRLGLEGVRVEEWRSGAAPFPSVRVSATSIIDLIPGGSPTRTGTVRAVDEDGRNLDHLCVVVAPCDLVEEANRAGLDVDEGPVRRFGARGWGTSIYVRDADGNTVELRYYHDLADALGSG